MASNESCNETKLSVADDEDNRVNLVQRAQWLRAAILGANDGLLSTTALMLGIGAAKDDHTVMIVSGLAGALAGACSMAVGEFVSVSTQRDIERMTNDPCNAMMVKDDCESPPRSPFMQVMAIDARADPLQESSQASNDKCCVTVLKNDFESVKSREFNIVSPQRSPFMNVVATDAGGDPLQESRRASNDKCCAKTVLKNNFESVKSRESNTVSPQRSPFTNVVARDTIANPYKVAELKNDFGSVKSREINIVSPQRSPFMKVVARDTTANPYKAAGASGLAFLCGSVVPLLSAMVFSEEKIRVVGIVVVASVAMAVFGGAGARLGGSPVTVSAMRVVVGGWISMAVTYGLLKPLDRDHNSQQL